MPKRNQNVVVNYHHTDQSQVRKLRLLEQPKASVTMTGTGLASSAAYNVFDSNNWSVFTSTDNIVETNIEYASSTGRFTATQAGTYMIIVPLIIVASATTTIDITVRRNGSIIHTVTPTAHSSVDPVERTIAIMSTLTAGQYIEIYVDSTSANTVTMQAGTTFNMYKVA